MEGESGCDGGLVQQSMNDPIVARLEHDADAVGGWAWWVVCLAMRLVLDPAAGAAILPQFAIRQVALPPAANNLQWCASIDFDSDGYPDLVAAGLSFPVRYPVVKVPMFALRNDRAGGFVGESSRLDPPVWTGHVRDMRVGDFDGDGREDLFAADFGSDGPPFPGDQSRILMQTEAGTLRDGTADRLPQLAAASHHASVGDVDGDGDTDIYLCNIWNRDGAGPRLYRNDGLGKFQTRAGDLPEEVSSMANRYTASLFVDVDGDEDQDLVLGGHAGTEERDRILLNDGTGRFTYAPVDALPRRASGLGGDTITIASADFDGDGRPDLALGGELGYAKPALQVVYNQGNGTFREITDAVPVPGASSWISFVRVGDLNGDGWIDLVFNLVGGGVKIFLNEGGTRFTDVSASYSFPSAMVTVEVADFDGDGNLDIYGQTLQGTAFLAHNLAAPSAPGFRGERRNQAVVFPFITARTWGEDPVLLAASASSGLPVGFSVVSGPATLDGNRLAFTGTGTVGIRASQPGNEDFNPSRPVIRRFVVLDGRPRLVEGPASVSVPNGESARFEVVVESRLPVRYQWFRSGVGLPGASESTLVLPAVTLEQAGAYSVVASTAVGEVTSAPAILTVTRGRQSLTFPTPPDLVVGGSPATLDASASSGLSVGYRVISGPAVIVGNQLIATGSGRVVVRAVQEGDEAYLPAVPVDRTLVASGPAPGFVDFLPSATLVAGSSWTIEASVVGDPPLAYEWRRNGVPLDGQTGRVLTLSSVHEGDEGAYSVLVRNASGVVVSNLGILLVSPVPAAFDFRTGDLGGWTVLRDVQLLSVGADGLQMRISGGDPSLNGPARDYPEGRPLWFEVSLLSDTGGTAQLFHFRTAASEAESVVFEVPADGAWHDYRLPLPALGPKHRLRFDPPGASGKCSIAGMRLVVRDPDADKAFPVLAWEDPAPILYGTKLDASSFVVEADVPGAFEFSPASGSLLAGGNHELVARFQPADAMAYRSLTIRSRLHVAAAPTRLNWPTPDPVVYGTVLGAGQLNASCDIPGAFEYSPGVGTILPAGERHALQVDFVPADPGNHLGATATVFLTVIRAEQVITFFDPGERRVDGVSVPLVAVASSGLPVRFRVLSGPGTLVGDAVIGTGPGDIVLRAEQPGDSNHDPAPPVDRVLRFVKNEAPLVRGISDVTLGEGEALALRVEAEDPDGPGSSLAYDLAGALPEGLRVDTRSGLLTWVPSESQGPGEYPVELIVADGGQPPAKTRALFSIRVREVNRPPVLLDPPVELIRTEPILTHKFVGTDPDLPGNQLRYALIGEVPPGLVIDEESGLLTWVSSDPNQVQRLEVGVVVEDDGMPRLASTNRLRLVAEALVPLVVRHPSSAVGVTGEAVSFEVGVAEGLPVQYRWRLDGTELPGATNAVLVLGAVDAGDAGTYSVVVGNEYGSVLSDLAILQVSPVYLHHVFAAGVTLGWTLEKQVGPLQGTAEGLVLRILGNDPGINSPAANYPPGMPLRLDLRLKSDAGGIAQVFYHRSGASEANSVSFQVPAGRWHDAHLDIPALGSGYRFRFDPPGRSGQCVLGEFRVTPRSAEDSKAFPVVRWADPAPIRAGTALGSAQLNATAGVEGTFKYLPTFGTLLPEGRQILGAEFFPADTNHFRTLAVQVPLTVLPAVSPPWVGALDSVTLDPSGHLQFRFPSMRGRSFVVEDSRDFLTWTVVETVEGTEGHVVYRVPTVSTSAGRFYRVRLAASGAVP